MPTASDRAWAGAALPEAFKLHARRCSHAHGQRAHSYRALIHDAPREHQRHERPGKTPQPGPAYACPRGQPEEKEQRAYAAGFRPWAIYEIAPFAAPGRAPLYPCAGEPTPASRLGPQGPNYRSCPLSVCVPPCSLISISMPSSQSCDDCQLSRHTAIFECAAMVHRNAPSRGNSAM